MDQPIVTRLPVLRRQLSSLRRKRTTARLAAAYCALLVAVLWLLSGVFALDVLFNLSGLQRLVVMVVAAAGVVWAYSYFTAPLLGVRENVLEMALMVERQQRIDSDLVAALQFESPAASVWGSQQLESAVIDYVSQLGSGLNVFEGFSRGKMFLRMSLLTGTLAVLGGLAVPLSGYYSVFFNHLLFGSRHYPSDTVIEQVIVNHQLVLLRSSGDPAKPESIKCAQGRSLEFLVQCSGKKPLPRQGLAELKSSSSQTPFPLKLVKISPEDRLGLLQKALGKLNQPPQSGAESVTEPELRELASLVRFDAPAALEWIEKSRKDRSHWNRAAAEVKTVIDHWPPKHIDRTEVYRGTLERLADDLQYTLRLGDAWTDPARVAMIPLPVVETQLASTPPPYAATVKQNEIDPGARQIYVLEGSRVDVSIRCINKKKLTKAWLTARIGEESFRYPLVQSDRDGYRWSLPTADTPFANVQSEFHYEIQILDSDQLQLETPIRGYIRLKADRKPTVVLVADYRAVMPQGSPALKVRLSDDYGIGKLEARIFITRNLSTDSPSPPDSSGSEQQAVQNTKVVQKIDILHHLTSKGKIDPNPKPIIFPLEYKSFPVQGSFILNLTRFSLIKGDRVNVVVAATEDRGDFVGQTGESDPIVLEVTDEAGMLAASSEIDGRSEKEISEIEKRQKQLLGIGD